MEEDTADGARPQQGGEAGRTKITLAVAPADLRATSRRDRRHPGDTVASELQPGTVDDALCQTQQIEHAAMSLHRIRRRLKPDYDSTQCDVSLRAILQRWSARCPLACLTREQLAVFIAAERVGCLVGDVHLPADLMRGIFDGGQYIVVIEDFGKEPSATSSLDLAVANLFAPLAVQQLAGGHLSSWPSRVLAAIYFTGHGHQPSERLTAVLVERQFTIYNLVCAHLALYNRQILKIASILLSHDPQADLRIDRITSRSTPPKTDRAELFFRFHHDLLASLADLPYSLPAGEGVVH